MVTKPTQTKHPRNRAEHRDFVKDKMQKLNDESKKQYKELMDELKSRGINLDFLKTQSTKDKEKLNKSKNFLKKIRKKAIEGKKDSYAFEDKKGKKAHAGRSAKRSAEKDKKNYRGEECFEPDDPNDPNDPSVCI